MGYEDTVWVLIRQFFLSGDQHLSHYQSDNFYIDLNRINSLSFIFILSYLQGINTYLMKADDQLQLELLKLKELAPSPIDYSFLMGYLAYALPCVSVPQIKPTINNIISLMNDGLISSQNVLQLLVVLRFKIFMSDYATSSKRLIPSIDNYINELALDNQYLTNKYLSPPPKLVEIKSEGMGVECSICLGQIDYATLCLLSCNHMFHRQCFNQHAKAKIEDKNIPFHCPQDGCNRQILLEEISQFLNKAQREKYDEFMFQVYVEHNNMDTQWCPTPGCQAVFAFDEDLTNYKCPTCKKHYCLRCKCEMHTGLSCEEYRSMADLNEDDKKFMILVKGAKYKQCPNCKFWVEKNEGCDHMTCRCKYEFCYVCGGKYGACKCTGHVQLEMPMMRAMHRRPMPEIPDEMPMMPHASSEQSVQSDEQIRMQQIRESQQQEHEVAYYEELFRKAEQKKIEQQRQQQEKEMEQKKRKIRKQEVQKLKELGRMQFIQGKKIKKKEESPQISLKQELPKLQLQEIERKLRQRVQTEEKQEKREKQKQFEKASQHKMKIQTIISQQKKQKIEMPDPVLKPQKQEKTEFLLKQEKNKSMDVESFIKYFKQKKDQRQKLEKQESKIEKVELKSDQVKNKGNLNRSADQTHLLGVPRYIFSYLHADNKEKSKEDIPKPKKEQQ